MENNVLIWGGLGVLMMLLEIIIPGGIIIFLGISAVVVALTLQLGLIDHWVHAFTCWFILSLLLLLLFRNITQKMVGGDTRIDNTDEELDMFGAEVEVVETIGPGNQKGRVMFQGSSWTALGDGSEIKPGEAAKVICRENISLVVERIES
ncbi:NfeD family protein [Thalassotalea litorea]|uniref:NfeD family protein n=1 Tax=Thalassotalea litorea TaxID=2020715 RepID=UPI0037368C99